MTTSPSYPNADMKRDAQSERGCTGARIAWVVPDTPAYDAGFEPGCLITHVEGQPVRDIIDWRWLTGDECITVGYIDLDGDSGEVELWRNPGEEWGFEFDGLVFDGVKQCRNACTFCFMRQLPAGMRPSLSLRDDDFRLSFLVGTFVTLTNLTPEDEARIVEQRISPLRVSLQASGESVRRRLIGRHAQHGIDALDRLLAAGIQFHAQIVLVPGENDGEALAETLTWAYARPGILGVGIVPLGYTRHQDLFDHSFNDEAAARGVLSLVAPFQERALAERGTPWVFAADEFYRNAYARDLLDNLPSSEFYGDFAMFEDGIGIIRSTVDDWTRAAREGAIVRCAAALREAGVVARMVVGCAQREFLDPLIAQSGIADCFSPLYVENAFFGGNVDVTGLLVGKDMSAAIRETIRDVSLSGSREEASCSDGPSLPNNPLRCSSSVELPEAPPPANQAGYQLRQSGASSRGSLLLIPRVVFNDDGVTLDGFTLADMEKAAGQTLHMVSCTPAEYFAEIASLIVGLNPGGANPPD